MPPLKLALFDCDGTIIDSQHSIVHAMDETFKRHGHEPVPARATRSIIGLPLDVAIARLLGDEPSARHEDYAETYREVFRGLRLAGDVSEPLYDGARETIESLDSSGWLLGIATGKPRRGVDAAFQPIGLLERFVTIQTADVARGKPDPDMVLRALSETGADRDDTVVIGDTTFDIQMARNAGVRAIGVSWGYHPSQALLDAGAHVVIDEWNAVEATLVEMTGSTTT